MNEVNEVLGKLFETGKIKLPKFGKEVTVKKITLRTMKPVLDLASRVIADLKLSVENLPSVNLQDPSLLLKLISTYYDDVIRIVVSLSSVSEDELLDMEQDESILLVQAVVALNKDFFTKKVLPNLRLLGETAEG